ncbi:hypothetical protein DPX39_090041400 [Trypanosoma brucei equiperdum]|uniref:Uncharacterized protein n=1 Tax=Trypanosoma brucei equiperdum TaxID=630700 RepID=A0A3L6L4P0_9TRYP|nr:hypothetical protein DPX39_090041400 [Trypanosoma brucei equiperdum]
MVNLVTLMEMCLQRRYANAVFHAICYKVVRRMRILFGVLLLISCLSASASDDPCYYTKWMNEGKTDNLKNLSSKGGEEFFENDKKWIFCDSLNYRIRRNFWNCSNEKTLNELVEDHESLRNEVVKGDLCNQTTTTETEMHVKNVTDLKTELDKKKAETELLKLNHTTKTNASNECKQLLTKLKNSNATVTTLEAYNREKENKIKRKNQQCNSDIKEITAPLEVQLEKKAAVLNHLKQQVETVTQKLQEEMKENSCSVCSAETCYSTPSVKAELDKKYLENSWLNLTAAQREQCLLDDAMLLPMLSYMRRKPFDGAYAYNQNVDMMEKLFALVISFLCFLI